MLKEKNEFIQLHNKDEINHLIGYADFCINKLERYGKNDIRRDYFSLMKTCIENYNLNLKNFFLRILAENHSDKSYLELERLEKEDIKRVFSNLEYVSFAISLKRYIILETWSLFEFAINTIFEHIFDKSDIEKMQTERYAKNFKKVLKTHINDENILTDIIQDLSKNLDKHIPTNRKLQKVLKQTKHELIKEDEEFLLFLGRLRNGIHNNFIYKGKSQKPFVFGEYEFTFEDGQSILKKAEKPLWDLDIVEKFMGIVLSIFENLNINQLIPNPLPTLNEYWK